MLRFGGTKNGQPDTVFNREATRKALREARRQTRQEQTANGAHSSSLSKRPLEARVAERRRKARAAAKARRRNRSAR